jgi:hypothetical protein
MENMTYVVAPNWGKVEYQYYPENFCPGRSQIADYFGRIIASAPYPGESVVGALIDIEALRQARARMHMNQWSDMRFDPFKEIYETTILPPNLFLDHPPESLAQKMERGVQAYKNLYARGIFTRPSGETETVAERLAKAQEQGTLKK